MYKKLIIVLLLLISISSLFAQRYQESDDFSYALKLYNEGFYDIAAQQFNLFLNKYAGSERAADAKYYQAYSLFHLKEFADARIEFQSLAVSFPDNNRAAEAWLKVGECYLKLNQFEEAARAFETVKVLYPANSNAPIGLYQAAKVYLSQGMYQKCKITLQDFLDRYVDNSYYPSARLLYARLMIYEQQFDAAGNEISKVLNSEIEMETAAEALMLKAELYEHLGQIEKAKDLCSQIIKNYSKSNYYFKAVTRLVDLQVKSHDYDSAVKTLNTYSNVFRNSEQKAVLNLRSAAVNFIKGDYFSARRAIGDLPETMPNDTLRLKKMFYLAHIYKGEAKYDLSLESFEQILKAAELAKINPDMINDTRKEIGLLKLRAGELDNGIAFINDYLETTNSSVEKENLYQQIFYAALQQGQIQRAERIYAQLVNENSRLAPRDDMLFRLAKFNFNSGQYLKSKEQFQEIAQQYYCSEKYDSTLQYLKVIHYFYDVDQGIGVNKLAKLVGRMLADIDRQQLQLDLAKIYLFQLKEVDDALFQCKSLVSNTADSSLLCQANHLMAEAHWRKTMQPGITNPETEWNLAKDSFKKAMVYISHSANPDSLAYGFLLTSINENTPIDKQLQYWEHFVKTYSGSKFLPHAQYTLANIVLSNRDTTNAKLFLQALTKSENIDIAGDSYYKLAEIAFSKNNVEQGSNHLKDFLLNISHHPLRAQAYKQLAELSIAANNYSDASAFLTRLNNEYNYSPAGETAMLRIPEMLLRSGDYQTVLDLTNNYVTEKKYDDLLLSDLYSPDYPDFYFLNGMANYKLGKSAEGRRRIYSYVYGKNNKNYRDEALVALADMESERNEDNSALLFLGMVTSNSNSKVYIQAAERTADIYFRQGKYKEARQLYLEMITKSNDPQSIHHYRKQEMLTYIHEGSLKLYDSKLGTYKNQYKNTRELNEDLATFEFELGKYYYQNKNFDAAIKKFKKVANDYKTTSLADDGYYYQGLTYATLNKIEDAQKILSSFRDKYPNSPVTSNVYITLGNLYYGGEKQDLAVDAFKKAVEFATDHDVKKVAQSNLIKLYHDLGLWDGMLSNCREYIEENPNADDVIDKKMLIGTALINLNRYSEAVDFLKKTKLEATSEQEPEIQFYIGEAYFNAGQYENAIREFVKIPLLSKQTKLQWEASALYFSGQSYEKLGRIDDAIRMYQEIIDRPGIIVDLKREARKKIEQLKKS